MEVPQPLRFHRIMVPVDESRPSINSLAVAAGMARESGATVVLTHVVATRWAGDDVSEARRAYGGMFEDLEQAGKKSLDRLAENDTFDGLEVEKRLLYGDPAKALIEAADRENIDLIVMGSRGRGSWGQMLLGSVSQRVIHDAKVPVVIVPPHLEQVSRNEGS